MRTGVRPSTGVKQIVDRFRELFTQVTALGALKGDDLLDAWIPADGRPGHLIISASQEIPLGIAMKGIAIAGIMGVTARTNTSRFLGEMGPESPKPVAP